MNVSPTFDNNNKEISGFFPDSTPFLQDQEALQARADQEGMLFFKSLIPKADILEARRDVLQVLERFGMLDKQAALMEGIADAERMAQLTEADVAWNGVGITEEVYRAIQSLESFHGLSHHPNLLAMYRLLFGSDVFPHPRNIARVMLPHRYASVTPSHQDFLHVQGHEETWTSWIPLGDIPRALGGLTVLSGSHKAGLLGVTQAPGAGGLETILCGMNYEWLTTDYEVGDVLTFNSLTVHKSTVNTLPGRIRLSCDYRYQAKQDPIRIEKGSLMPHGTGTFSWDDLYEGWVREDLKYFWEKENFELVDYDSSIRWQKEKIC